MGRGGQPFVARSQPGGVGQSIPGRTLSSTVRAEPAQRGCTPAKAGHLLGPEGGRCRVVRSGDAVSRSTDGGTRHRGPRGGVRGRPRVGPLSPGAWGPAVGNPERRPRACRCVCAPRRSVLQGADRPPGTRRSSGAPQPRGARCLCEYESRPDMEAPGPPTLYTSYMQPKLNQKEKAPRQSETNSFPWSPATKLPQNLVAENSSHLVTISGASGLAGPRQEQELPSQPSSRRRTARGPGMGAGGPLTMKTSQGQRWGLPETGVKWNPHSFGALGKPLGSPKPVVQSGVVPSGTSPHMLGALSS